MVSCAKLSSFSHSPLTPLRSRVAAHFQPSLIATVHPTSRSIVAGGKAAPCGCPPFLLRPVSSHLVIFVSYPSRLAQFRSTLFTQFSRSHLMPAHTHTLRAFAFPRDSGPASNLRPSSNSQAWTNHLHYSMSSGKTSSVNSC